jgi:hypothetical protein
MHASKTHAFLTYLSLSVGAGTVLPQPGITAKVLRCDPLPHINQQRGTHDVEHDVRCTPHALQHALILVLFMCVTTVT